jgi:hypothetical protein
LLECALRPGMGKLAFKFKKLAQLLKDLYTSHFTLLPTHLVLSYFYEYLHFSTKFELSKCLLVGFLALPGISRREYE